MHRPGRPAEEGSVGCAVGDYDNDGELDLFVTSYGVNILYRNKGDGRFEDVAPHLGLAEDNHAVGAAWGDYDNDGWLDLRSEENTSELQSLMRISYAVFCLKKKT